MPSKLRLVTIFSLVMASAGFAAPTSAQGSVQSDPFTPCADTDLHPVLAATDCAFVDVPLDHAQPVRGEIEIFVRRFRAEGEARGQIWLVAGGPGESGASFYPFIDTLKAAAPGYDLLIPDHRGTGFSTRLCPVEEAQDGEGGSSLVGAEWGTCFGALNAQEDRTRAFTISNAARDLAGTMSRLGKGERTYVYGVSYGTQLVLRMLVIGAPHRLDGIILDSLVPPESEATFDLGHRSGVTDRVGREVLKACDEQAECRQMFPGGAAEALGRILEREDAAKEAGTRLRYQLASMLDYPETRAMIPNVIAGLQSNDPAWLTFALDWLETRGAQLAQLDQSTSSIPLVSLISRSENNARPELTSEVIEHEAQGYLFASPLPSLLLAGGIPTYQRDESFGTYPAAFPPTIVLQGSLDPKTPFAGAQQQVARLRSRGDITLIRVERAPHFILMTAPDAFKEAVQHFLEAH